MRWNFWTGLITLALLMLGFYLLNPLGTATLDPRARITGYVPYQVPANSMAPTVQAGDHILGSAWAYVGNEPARGDVVVFVSPVNDISYVKRIIGLPGDRLAMHDHRVYINGKLLDEPYLLPAPPMDVQDQDYGDLTETRIADGELFMLGDNRRNSADSRLWGSVPRANLIGRVERIWWAQDPQRIGKVH
ncbi:signal peptidase I [Pseudomonas sp. 8O]|uniref:signal peptidase I n=1 Tax=Pseudomonas sp. 8O TaxID=2653165 RepID=UPI0012EF0F8A|nr:signal peptidase I [Pseudomonas sp. 8O]VXB66799.1 Signal peptidase I [Pseudomonas sp. 8O]